MQSGQINRRGSRFPKQKPQCRKGWHCDGIISQSCDSQHFKEDVQKAKMLRNLKKYENIILIVDTYAKESICMSLLQPTLPIYALNRQFQLEKGFYYEAFIAEEQGNDQLLVKIGQKLGQFGNWTIEKKILQKYFPHQYRLDETGSKSIKIGQIKINGELTKVLPNHEGRKHYFKKVNQDFKYPLIKGCKVSYNDEGSLKILKIDYPRDVKMCGIIQIDKNSQFYFISRNQEYDDLNPCNIPQEIEALLQGQKVVFPYSHLNSFPLSENNNKKINSILEKYLLKGHFKGWPLQSRFPIIELQNQVNEKNFKSLKDGIIYEAGISMTPFDRHQKQQAQKLAKKFDIANYENRKKFKQSIYTVDGIKTKCHDDALSIFPTENGQYWVQIHIADAAALIEKGSEIDSKIKKRDETIYIKNYYQPMICDPLKNLLSLKQKSDKLAFSLIFKIDSKGFVNYSTVRLQKTIINVSQNLSHQKMEKKKDKYPELLQLNHLFDESKLVDTNYILQSQTKSEVAMSRLIFISSIIPTYLLNRNIKKAKTVKSVFDEHLKQLVQKRKQQMQIWQGLVDAINAEKSVQAKIVKEMKNIQKKIDLEINKQRDIIMKKVKQQQKAAKVQSKKRRQIRGMEGSFNDSQQQNSDNQNQQQAMLSLEKQNEQQLEKLQIKQKEELNIQQDEQQQQKKKKEKRTKILKEVNISDLQESEQESENSQDTQSHDERGDQQLKRAAAIGGKKFLQSIFKNPLFNIDMKWRNMDEINDAFKLILSKDTGKLYQQYFKRVQIMNRQHFKYILIIQRDNNKQKFPQKYEKPAFKEEQRVQKIQTKQIIRKQRRPKKKNSEVKENDFNQKIKKEQKNKAKQLLVEQQKLIKKAQDTIIRQPPAKQQKIQKLIPEAPDMGIHQSPQQQKNEMIQSQKSRNRQKKIGTKMIQFLKNYMDKQSSYYSKKYEQYYKNKKLQICNISINKKDEQFMQDKITKDEYLIQKRRRLVVILKRNQKAIQKNVAKNDKKLEKNNQKQQKVESEFAKMPVNQIYSKLEPIVMEKKQYYVQKYSQDFVSGKQFAVSDQECAEQQKSEYQQIKKMIILKIFIKTFRRSKNGVYTKKKDKKNQIDNKEKLQEKFEKTTEIVKQDCRKSDKQIQQPKQKRDNEKQVQLTFNAAKMDQQDINQAKTVQISQKIPKDLKSQKSHSKNMVKLSKREIKKIISQKLEPIAKEISEKYKQERKNLNQKIQIAKLNKKQKEQQLSKAMQSLEEEYNLFSLLTTQGGQGQKDKRSKRQKRLNNNNNNKKKEKSESKQSLLLKFLENFQLYAEKANFNFRKMKIEQIDKYLEQSLRLKEINEDKISIQQENRVASNLGENEEELLKWNNPIRSYESLMVMRIIKSFSWLFEGKIFPTDIVRYYDDLKEVQRLVKQLELYRRKKMENGELNKKAKQANRQIAKLQFQNMIKNNPNSVYRFLNVGSPCPQKVKFVFHPILDNLEVDNLQFRQQIYKQVQGKVIIVRQFPLKLRVLLEN